MKDVVDAAGQAARSRSGSPSCEEGVFYAELVFDAGLEVSARPPTPSRSRCGPAAPIFGAEDVLDEAGIEIPDEQEDEVEKFREFLDQISPEDFEDLGGSAGGPTPSTTDRGSRSLKSRLRLRSGVSEASALTSAAVAP